VRPACLIALALALVCAGCGDDDSGGNGGGGGGNSSDGGGSGDSGGGGDTSGGGVPADFSALVKDTETALEDYWAGALGSFSGGSFTAPARVEAYTEDNPPRGSACLKPSSPEWEGNSFYCPPDEALYLDADFLPELGAEFDTPETATVLVHAHEFGHHLQALDAAEPALDVGNELQADCYAGVFMSAVESGAASLDVGELYPAAALNTMRDLADSNWEQTSWFEPGAHGGPVERAQAMATGYLTEDAQFCAGYESTGPIEPVTVGPQGSEYTFRPPPAAKLEELERGYRMTIGSQADSYMDIGHWNSLEGAATEAISQVAPTHFGDSQYEYVGDVEDFDVGIEGFDIANVRYQQVLDGDTFHGALVLVTRSDGTGLLLDAYRPGPAPGADDHAAWLSVGNYAFSSLWGITE
jgi:uncharacterized protein